MSIQTLDHLLAKHTFFADFSAADLELIAGCASNVRFAAGERVFQEGQAADRFFLLRSGKVAVQVYAPGKGAVTFQTLDADQVLGWSWLLPPFRWKHDALALEPTRAFAFDGACLRRKCDQDARFGYLLMRHIATMIAERLHYAQVQLMDLYGEPKGA